MDEDLIHKWNSVVKYDDLVYHLGNFGVGSVSDLSKIFSRLNGKISIVRGNSDSTREELARIGFSYICDKSELVYKNYILQMTNADQVYEIFPRFGFCSYDAVICIHGGTKSRTQINNNYINVACDAWNYTPIEINQLMRLYRINKCKDISKGNHNEIISKDNIFRR